MQALKTDVLLISGFIRLYSIKTRDKRISFNYPQVYSINPFNVFQGKTVVVVAVEGEVTKVVVK